METQIIYTLKEADLLEKFDTQMRCAVKDGLSELSTKQGKSTRINYITRKEVCEMLHISYPTLHRLVNRGVLPCMKIGRRSLFDLSVVRAAIVKRNVDCHNCA